MEYYEYDQKCQLKKLTEQLLSLFTSKNKKRFRAPARTQNYFSVIPNFSLAMWCFEASLEAMH